MLSTVTLQNRGLRQGPLEYDLQALPGADLREAVIAPSETIMFD